MAKKKRDTSSPYEEYKKQPSQIYKKKYIQLSLPLNHGVNETWHTTTTNIKNGIQQRSLTED